MRTNQPFSGGQSQKLIGVTCFFWQIRLQTCQLTGRYARTIARLLPPPFRFSLLAAPPSQGNTVPSGIVRTNRSGGDVGTSPGINPITPYTTASLDYRASWIAGQMVGKTKVTHNEWIKTRDC